MNGVSKKLCITGLIIASISNTTDHLQVIAIAVIGLTAIICQAIIDRKA